MAITKNAISVRGLDLIKSFEGLRLAAYQDVAGVWTIGYGCTFYANGKRIQPGDKLVNKECASDLLGVVLRDFERTVNRVVTVALNQNQYDALVSFHFNTGSLPSSTLLRKLNAGDFGGAAAQFDLWVKVTDPKTGKKVVNDTLVKRRAKEQKLFTTPI
ncbi:lysozyme [Mucilaginibacter sp. SMC90]|uniref:lysozyme n=1 Tax=Mucilaginibacter sp. SMC90 TaxID=2929803 RepID=UPI001FB3C970|nr:lysozyme [Mucilaginibacter sp. SMC90]UOE47984.1 lysozyme [Mucilaginibacter sp. SMC90]